jgi:hypothetical protein
MEFSRAKEVSEKVSRMLAAKKQTARKQPKHARAVPRHLPVLPKPQVLPIVDAHWASRAREVQRDCYAARGKISGSSAEAESGKPGTLFGVFQAGLLVGSFRVHAPVEGDLLEGVDKTLGFYPKDFPPRSNLIEISGLCLLPTHRSFESFKLIYAEIHRALVKSGRAWLLIGSDKILARKYRFIGFRETSYSYRKENSAFPEIVLMLSHQKPFGTYGLNADPVRWNLFLREVTDELVSEGILHHSPVQKLVLGAYRRFKLPAQAIAWAARRKWVRV